MTYEVGDVILVPFPFTDQSASKQRPAAVISSLPYNSERPDLIIAAVTSRVREPLALGEVLVRDWRDAGLVKPSMIKPVVATLSGDLIKRTLGKLTARDLVDRRTMLKEIIG